MSKKLQTILLSYELPPFQALNSTGTSITLKFQETKKRFLRKDSLRTFEQSFSIPHSHKMGDYYKHWDQLIKTKGVINPKEL